jgi:hypothetical protein
MVRWRDAALRPAANAPKPLEIIAALEGGLLMARAARDPALLRAVVSATLKRVRK